MRSQDVFKIAVLRPISLEVSQELHQLSQALLLDLKLCLYQHVDKLLRVRLPSCYHLVQLWAEAIEKDTLLLTATLAVLGHCLRLNQLKKDLGAVKGTPLKADNWMHNFMMSKYISGILLVCESLYMSTHPCTFCNLPHLTEVI